MKEMTISANALAGKEAASGTARRGNRRTRVPEILEQAIKVFALEGNTGFTQRRVAAATGIRLATLQHYFGTRELLLHGAIEELARRFLKQYRTTATNTAMSPEARLDNILDATFAALTDPDNVVSSFALECWCLAEHLESVSELMAQVSGDFQEIFSRLVAEINVDLPPDECRIRGALLYSHWQGLIVFLRRSKHNTPDVYAFQIAAKAVWRAVSKASK